MPFSNDKRKLNITSIWSSNTTIFNSEKENNSQRSTKYERLIKML